MKKLIALFLCLFMACSAEASELGQNDVRAQGAILMNYETGDVLWQKNADTPLAMASTTKIMTALIALESGRLDEEVVVSKRASIAPKVRLGVREGEKFRLGDLLYPLMLQSSNDVAVAIAEHLGGSVEGFAEMMNKRAEEMGCRDTVFVTSNGLDSGNHHSTAYDLALITKNALDNEDFRELIKTSDKSIQSNKRVYSVYNKNRLLNEFEGALGVKTGFTGKAGQCFVGAAKRGDMTLISVVLASGWGSEGKERKWIDTKRLLSYGFENFEIVCLAEKLSAGIIPVERAKKDELEVFIKEEVYACVNKADVSRIVQKREVVGCAVAPIEKGQKMGEISYYLDENCIGRAEIVACEGVERFDFSSNLEKIIKDFINL